jgi:hypothetical protein
VKVLFAEFTALPGPEETMAALLGDHTEHLRVFPGRHPGRSQALFVA